MSTSKKDDTSGKKRAEDPPLRDDRKRCWQARDLYWACLDANRGDETKCDRTEFEKNCSKVWVAHFDRKYRFERAPEFDTDVQTEIKSNLKN